MNERIAKGCLISFNVIFLMAGFLMIVGGALLEFTEIGKSILLTLNPVATSSQLGAIGVALIAVGALITLVSLMGCCGAAYESRCLLLLYFGSILLLLLCQIGIAIAAFVMGASSFFDLINDQLRRYVNGYGERNAEAEDAVVDTVQQFVRHFMLRQLFIQRSVIYSYLRMAHT